MSSAGLFNVSLYNQFINFTASFIRKALGYGEAVKLTVVGAVFQKKIKKKSQIPSLATSTVS